MIKSRSLPPNLAFPGLNGHWKASLKEGGGTSVVLTVFLLVIYHQKENSQIPEKEKCCWRFSVARSEREKKR
jgi:hypothetical protein